MKCKLKLELAKVLILDFELSSGKDKEVKVDEQKESAPADTAPSKPSK